MGNLSSERFLVILIVALLVLGPEKLPGATRKLAQFVGDLKRWNDRLHSELHGSFGESLAAVNQLKAELNDVAQSLRDTVTSPSAGAPSPVDMEQDRPVVVSDDQEPVTQPPPTGSAAVGPGEVDATFTDPTLERAAFTAEPTGGEARP